MPLFLFNILVALEPGTGGLDLPPQTDPIGRWIVGSMAFLTVLSPMIAAHIKTKTGASNGPPLNGGSPTPRLDVGQEWLDRYVKGVEERLRVTESKYDDLDRRYQTLLEERATIRAQYQALRDDNAELRDEVHTLRGRLMGHG